jgi:hypothetical protein
MARASDLPIEIYLHILSYLPPDHEQQVRWRRRAAVISSQQPHRWNFKDYRCGQCGKVMLFLGEGRDWWVLRGWENPIYRVWEECPYWVTCTCGRVIGNLGEVPWSTSE